MNLWRAPHLGFCFGVRHALDLAGAHAAQAPLTTLGDLVHNETVLARLRARGIESAACLERVGTRAVLITAHGASPSTRDRARALGLDLIDATCPLVRFAHQVVAGLVRAGYHPVIVGQRPHVEVRGLTEDLAEYDVVLTPEEVAGVRERRRFGVVAQTTQPLERVLRLVRCLEERFPRAEVRFVDTVCRPTKQRQAAAVALARRCELMVVVGGAHSNNTRELAATCQQYCSRVITVQTAGELRSEWFRDVRTVGLTAGTSTPDDVIAAVESWLRALAEVSDPVRARAQAQPPQIAVWAS